MSATGSDAEGAGFDVLREALRRKEWGDHTVLSMCATASDEHGDFQVAIIQEGHGEPVWEPAQCNVDGPEAEYQEVMNHFSHFYRQWQAERYEVFGEWKPKQEGGGMTVLRDGEPELVRGPQKGSVQRPNEYEIRTTALPSGAKGVDWLGYFNSRFTGYGPFRGLHDGSKITIECSEDDAPQLIETVDEAIEYANEKVRK